MKCIRCHNEYDDMHLSCPFCGTEKKKQDTKTLHGIKCPRCERQFDINLAFCSNCGRGKSSSYTENASKALVPVDSPLYWKKRMLVPLLVGRDISLVVSLN